MEVEPGQLRRWFDGKVPSRRDSQVFLVISELHNAGYGLVWEVLSSGSIRTFGEFRIDNDSEVVDEAR